MHVPGCFVFRPLTYWGLQICGSRFLNLLVFVCCLMGLGHPLCACTDYTPCLHTHSVCAQLKWGCGAADWQIHSVAPSPDSSFTLK